MVSLYAASRLMGALELWTPPCLDCTMRSARISSSKILLKIPHVRLTRLEMKRERRRGRVREQDEETVEEPGDV